MLVIPAEALCHASWQSIGKAAQSGSTYQTGIKSKNEGAELSLLLVLKAVTPEVCANHVFCDACWQSDTGIAQSGGIWQPGIKRNSEAAVLTLLLGLLRAASREHCAQGSCYHAG